MYLVWRYVQADIARIRLFDQQDKCARRDETGHWDSKVYLSNWKGVLGYNLRPLLNSFDSLTNANRSVKRT